MILHTKVVRSENDSIMFLHSGLQTGMIDFQKVIPYFNDEYGFLLPDLRGHGKSNIGDIDEHYIQNSAQDVIDTLDELKIDKVHLVGVSLGALIALQLVTDFNDRVHSVSLAGLMYLKPENYEEIHQYQITRQYELLERENAVALLNKMHGPSWRKFFDISSYQSWYPFHLTKNVGHLNVPVQIVIAEKNINESNSIHPNLKEKLNIASIKGTSHMANLENPKAYAESVKAFIDDVSNT